ncbi:hypothetical protein C3943_16395 [Lysinibacillus sp. B2A1]|nr:hypothetical protein C3943_16395 [Lysinibacillus sp. B2A1]
MQDSVQLLYKNRWLQEAYLSYKGEHLDHPYQYDFRLTWGAQCIPQKVRINNQILHTFFDDRHIYEFTLPFMQPIVTVELQYILDKEILYESFNIIGTKTFKVVPEMLHDVQTLYRDWKDNFKTAYDIYEEKYIEFADFYTKKEKQDLWSQLKKELEECGEHSPYWFYHYRQDILKHLQFITRKPKLKLESEHYLVNAEELDVVTPQTVQYFMKDTTTWRRTTLNRPVPQQLLKESYIESLDVHENRFVFTFAYMLEKNVRQFLKLLREHIQNIQREMNNTNSLIELNILREEAEWKKLDVEQYLEFFNCVYRQMKPLHALLREALRLFRGLQKLHGYIQPNQVLLYNRDYKTLYKLYNEFLNKGEPKEQKWHDHIDYQTYYVDSVFIDILQMIVETKLFTVASEPLKLPIGDYLDDYIFPRKDMVVEFTHSDVLLRVTRVQNENFEAERSVILLEMIRHDINKVITYRLVPTFVQFHEGLSKAELEGLYKYPVNGVSTFIIHPSKEEDYSKQLTYNELHRLFNLGMNFLEDEHYEQFGNMKYGAFSSAVNMAENIKRLLRLQLFTLGVRHVCFICGNHGNAIKQQKGEEEYVCSNVRCKVEWGVRCCSKCGTEIYKMQKKIEATFLTEEQIEEITAKRDIAWLLDAEKRNGDFALANFCENAHLGNNFFAICPNCGDCQQKTKKNRLCRRCDVKSML